MLLMTSTAHRFSSKKSNPSGTINKIKNLDVNASDLIFYFIQAKKIGGCLGGNAKKKTLQC